MAKIRYWQAQQIGEAVAKKAFEHLWEPKMKLIVEEATIIYNSIVNIYGLGSDEAAMLADFGIIHSARNMLASRIRQDLEGKTHTVVNKTWPEIASFVNETLGIDAPALVVPFSDVLHKYISPLLALTNETKDI